VDTNNSQDVGNAQAQGGLMAEVIYGENALEALDCCRERTAAVTMPVPWETFEQRSRWRPSHVAYVSSMDLASVEALEQNLPPADVVIGVGGGSACDMAKYVAWKRNIPLILVPTVLSVDAAFTPTIAVRERSIVRYVGNITPERILIDYRLIQSAPPELNRAGAADIASIQTALHDWKLAATHSDERFDSSIAAQAQRCLEQLYDAAEDIYHVTPAGIRALAELFQEEVRLCAEHGNSRPEEGSEHIVAYAIEHYTKRHFIHGDLVGFGIYAMAMLQENNLDYAVSLMKRCGIRYTLPSVERKTLESILLNLVQFKRDANLFFSVLDVKPPTPEWVQYCLDSLPA